MTTSRVLPPLDQYEVVIVRHGTRAATRARLYLNFEDYHLPDSPDTIDYYFWIIRNQERTILVDLGFSEKAAQERSRAVIVDPIEAWRALGIVPESFTGEVIITHGHWDHTGHVRSFPRAQFYMARTEFNFWDSSASQPYLFRHLADERDLADLKAAQAQGRMCLVDPPSDVAPGVRLVAGPGHTPGQLMVEVKSRLGTILLASDAVHFHRELCEGMPFRHMSNLIDAFDTYDHIHRSSPAIVIPGHEPGITNRYPQVPGALRGEACVVGKL